MSNYTDISITEYDAKSRQRLLILVGPTASGKTAVAIELCSRLNGEIVSADSMQIYRGCDIGSAKATLDQRAAARHHLIDICRPDENYSAAKWAVAAQTAIEDIRSRGKLAIVVGGTGFYLRALLQPQILAAAPPDENLRRELEERSKREGNAALHEYLATLDSAAAARLHINDKTRVMRAIEVALFRYANPELQRQSTPPPAPYEYSAYGIQTPREVLYARVEARVDEMLRDGFMQELATLCEEFPDAPCLRSLGYAQMRPFLEKWKSGQPLQSDDGIDLWKRDTRRYAKRQITWFSHQLPTQWISAQNESGVAFTAEQLTEQIAHVFCNETTIDAS